MVSFMTRNCSSVIFRLLIYPHIPHIAHYHLFHDIFCPNAASALFLIFPDACTCFSLMPPFKKPAPAFVLMPHSKDLRCLNSDASLKNLHPLQFWCLRPEDHPRFTARSSLKNTPYTLRNPYIHYLQIPPFLYISPAADPCNCQSCRSPSCSRQKDAPESVPCRIL